ncbi:MAG: hypothetical protein R6U11_04640, partial [Bacteroidales bacterium]
GWPDFFIYKPIIFTVECKTGSGRLSKEQKRVKKWLEKGGIDYLVIRDNVDELIEYLEEKL